MLDFCKFVKDGSLESWDIEMYEIFVLVLINVFIGIFWIEIGSIFEFKVVIVLILI